MRKKILLPFKNDNFSNITIEILYFSLLLLVKLSLLILFASLLESVLCFFFEGFLSSDMALKGDSEMITVRYRL